MLNNIKVYNKKVIALVWEYIVLNSFFWRSSPRKVGQLCRKNSFNTIYSHTSAITYNISYLRHRLFDAVFFFFLPDMFPINTFKERV